MTDFPRIDLMRYPMLRHVRQVEVEIGPGDALFIPVGWWHCVDSLEVSVSVSFTDFKANNQFSINFPR